MLEDKDRIEIVRYRIENAHRTMDEVASQLANDWLKEQETNTHEE